MAIADPTSRRMAWRLRHLGDPDVKSTVPAGCARDAARLIGGLRSAEAKQQEPRVRSASRRHF
jgi:hypothetical protein